MAAVLFDDAVHGRQSEAGSLAELLCGEERLKKIVNCGTVHAAAVVAHLDNDVVRRGLTTRNAQFDPGVLFIRGLRRIEEKIDQNMLQGVRVG